MQFLVDLAKTDPKILFLLLCIVIAFFAGKRIEGLNKIRLVRVTKESKTSDDMNKAVISSIEISGMLSKMLSQDKDRLADALSLQAATFSKISDAQMSIKVGVDTLILNDQDSKTFFTDLRAKLDHMADCDDKLKILIEKLDKMGVRENV